MFVISQPRSPLLTFLCSNCADAPKLDVVNEQIYASGAGSSQGLDSVQMQHAITAPKLSVEGGGQIKATGGKNAQGSDSVHIQHALSTLRPILSIALFHLLSNPITIVIRSLCVLSCIDTPKLDVEGSGQVRGAQQ